MPRRSAHPCLVACLLTACASGPSSGAREEAVTRHFLSGKANDWEPTLTLGPRGTVHVMAARPIPPPPGARHPDPTMVTWTSLDGGTTFDTGATYALGGGDERLKADASGQLFATWIRVEWDSTGRAPDMKKGGLVLARSRDLGKTWSSSIAAPMASFVADKPELQVSPDGRDVYIPFMGRGTLDVVASHDGGGTWERHVADSVRGGHWPSGSAIAPDGSVWIANVRNLGVRDSVLQVGVDLLHSRDRGVTWTRRELARASRLAAVDKCVHAPVCAVQIASPSVAVDARGRVYVAWTEGVARQVYALKVMGSDDRGVTWGAPTTLRSAPRPSSGDVADVYYPMIAADGDGLVYVAWFDDRDGPLSLWARRSTDGGRTWGSDVRLSRPEGMVGIYGEYGGIGIDQRGWLHVTWAEGNGHVSRPGSHGGTWYARWSGRVR